MTQEQTKLFSAKHLIRIGVYNVRTLYQLKLKMSTTAMKMDIYNIEIPGLSEVRWNTSGMTILSSGHTIVYSGNPNKDDIHDK